MNALVGCLIVALGALALWLLDLGPHEAAVAAVYGGIGGGLLARGINPAALRLAVGGIFAVLVLGGVLFARAAIAGDESGAEVVMADAQWAIAGIFSVTTVGVASWLGRVAGPAQGACSGPLCRGATSTDRRTLHPVDVIAIDEIDEAVMAYFVALACGDRPTPRSAATELMCARCCVHAGVLVSHRIVAHACHLIGPEVLDQEVHQCVDCGHRAPSSVDDDEFVKFGHDQEINLNALGPMIRCPYRRLNDASGRSDEMREQWEPCGARHHLLCWLQEGGCRRCGFLARGAKARHDIAPLANGWRTLCREHAARCGWTLPAGAPHETIAWYASEWRSET